MGQRQRRRSGAVAQVALVSAVVAVLAGTAGAAVASSSRRTTGFEVRTLDGLGNNRVQVTWGEAGTPYLRVAAPAYADGVATTPDGPNARYVSNRIFNDAGQNLFSENGITQWGWTWGQFLDHDLGLRDETPGESAPIVFDNTDPLEEFTNDFGALGFSRTPAAPGTGVTSAREQINTVSSFIDASNVYGTTADRLEWLREGSVNGQLSDNAASLLLPDGYLPSATERGDASTAPAMDLMGRLMGTPDQAVVAGDVRANENIALTAVHTLFAREHDRIVAALPTSLSEQARFDIARRVVGAEVQYVTYHEFLPALGVTLPRYRGYNPTVNPTLSNEFATVGYRAHSMVHGEFDVDFEPGDYSAEQLAAFAAQGISVVDEDDEHALVIPLTVGFGNPGLLRDVGVGNVLRALSAERQYNNDEQIDNTLRSVLFEVPKPDTTDPSACQTPAVDPACFSGVADLGADDIQRGRDHGMPSYNQLRLAYGLPVKTTFTAITGEDTDAFPVDAAVDASNPIDDPSILDFVELRDTDGEVLDASDPDAGEDAVAGTRRTTVAARLKALYGTVDAVDAFVGMVAEPHLPGSELGELQQAIWSKQFAALRDGDRFFFGNDPELQKIRRSFGVTYRHTLAELIRLNTDTAVPDRSFTIAAAVTVTPPALTPPTPAPTPTPTPAPAAPRQPGQGQQGDRSGDRRRTAPDPARPRPPRARDE